MSDCGGGRGRVTPESLEAHEASDASVSCEKRSRLASGRRRALLAAGAAFIASVALGVPGSGCLNPRPEELPSDRAPAPGQLEPSSEPPRETCDDNPALAQCDVPTMDINGNPVSEPSPDEESDSLSGDDPEAPAPSAQGDNAGGAAGAGGGDAGVPADAGAP